MLEYVVEYFILVCSNVFMVRFNYLVEIFLDFVCVFLMKVGVISDFESATYC